MVNQPTISDILTRVSNNLKSSLNLSDTELKTVLDAFSNAIAAENKLLYLFLADIQRNLFVTTADSELQGGTLERHGRERLGRDPNPASRGEFVLSITGDAGTTIPVDTYFKSNDDAKNAGQMYILESAYTLTGTDDVITVFSDGGGSEYDLSVNDILNVTTPIIGLDDSQTVQSITTQPLDAETLEDYRDKILLAIQLEPQGGSKSDYRQWALDASGVRNVYPYLKDGEAGTTIVYVEATVADSSDGYGTPSAAIISDVEDVIDFDPDDTKLDYERARRPLQSHKEVVSVDIVPVDVVITGLQDNSASVLSAIESNLTSYLFDIRPFVAGSDLLRNKSDILFSGGLQTSVIDSLSDGNYITNFAMYVNGVLKNTHTFSGGNIPYLRNITYV